MIDRITIENYKSIKKLQLKLGMVNIFIGSNGSGKSNFLSFLKFFDSIVQSRMQESIHKESSIEYILHKGEKISSYLKGRIELKSEKYLYYDFSLLPNNFETLSFQWEESGYLDNSVNYTFKNYFYMETKIFNLSNTMVKELSKRFSEYRVYHFDDTGKSAKIKVSCNLYDNHFLHEDGSNLASFLYMIKQTNKSSFDKIENTIRIIAPYFHEFILNPNPFNNDYIKLGWKEKDSSVLFNGHHFSDGTLRMICIITLFLQPNPPKIIILDEPELSLSSSDLTIFHELVQEISKKNVQVILSTKSKELTEKFNPKDIIHVDRINGESHFTRIC